MSFIIGGSDAYSTWAKLRSPIANWSISGSPVDEYFHSVHYLQGFRTALGNGYLATSVQMPGFNLSAEGQFWSPGHDTSPIWTEKQKNELIGKVVDNSGTTFDIDGVVFESPWYQETDGEPPITFIGGLVAFP